MAKVLSKNHPLLTDDSYESIKSLLMDHVILPGERVSIDALARDLKVSQTPIREALARLEADELVVRKPLTGYSATQVLTFKKLLDLYEFRFLNEQKAIELATKKLTIDGEKKLTLRGDNIAQEFQELVSKYIEQRFGNTTSTAN